MVRTTIAEGPPESGSQRKLGFEYEQTQRNPRQWLVALVEHGKTGRQQQQTQKAVLPETNPHEHRVEQKRSSRHRRRDTSTGESEAGAEGENTHPAPDEQAG